MRVPRARLYGRIIGSFRGLTLLERFALTSFVVFLALGINLSYFLDQSIRANAQTSAERAASDALPTRLMDHVTPADLTVPAAPNRQTWYHTVLDSSVLSQQFVGITVWNRQGVAVHSSDPRMQGHRFPLTGALASALRGRLTSDVSERPSGANGSSPRIERLLDVYIPIRFNRDGPVLGTFELNQRYDSIGAQIDRMDRSVYAIVAAGLFLLYLLLFGIVRSGSNTITRHQQEVRKHTDELEQSYRQTIASLAAAVDARDSSTERHCSRVTELAVTLGRWIDLSAEDLKDLERAALLHDVGKIGVGDAILLKPGSLTDEEWQVMRQHPTIGFHMLENIAFLENTLPVVLHHHERWDGSGYPDGLAGEDIPLFARLFAVIDAYDALTSDRPYRAGAPHHVAIQKLCAGAGTHFDPAMVTAFADMMQHRGVEHVLDDAATLALDSTHDIQALLHAVAARSVNSAAAQ